MKIRTDFNNIFEQNKIWIHKDELLKANIEPVSKMPLTLYDEEMEVEAILTLDTNTGKWFGIFDENKIKTYTSWNEVFSNRWKWGSSEPIYLMIPKSDGLTTSGVALKQWYVPSLYCDKCTMWISSNSYPQINVPKEEVSKYKWPVKTVLLNEYHEMIAFLKNMVDFEFAIPPLSSLGPSVVYPETELPDISFLFVPCFIKETAFRHLKASGLKSLEAVEAVVKDPHNKLGGEKLFELVKLPLAKLSRSYYGSEYPEPCEICGRRAIRKPGIDELIIDRKSIAQDLDIFECRDLPGYPIVTERFAEAVDKSKITVVEFIKLKVE